MFKDLLKISFTVLTVSLAVSIALPQSELAAQNLVIFDDIGGGGSSAGDQSSSNDNTFIYVLGGAVIAGILAYALIFKKDKDEETPDSTEALINNFLPEESTAFNMNREIEKAKDKLPVDFYFGIKQNEALKDDQYLLGIAVKF